jgi:hypothetical protein
MTALIQFNLPILYDKNTLIPEDSSDAFALCPQKRLGDAGLVAA